MSKFRRQYVRVRSLPLCEVEKMMRIIGIHAERSGKKKVRKLRISPPPIKDFRFYIDEIGGLRIIDSAVLQKCPALSLLWRTVAPSEAQPLPRVSVQWTTTLS